MQETHVQKITTEQVARVIAGVSFIGLARHALEQAGWPRAARRQPHHRRRANRRPVRPRYHLTRHWSTINRTMFQRNRRSRNQSGAQAGAKARADGLSSTAPTVIGTASDDGDLDQLQVGQLVSGGGLGGVADRVADAQT